MIISKDQISILKSLGFKARNKRRYSFLNDYNQFVTINVMDDYYQLEIDGRRIYGTELSFNDIIKIITILYPHESRKRV